MSRISIRLLALSLAFTLVAAACGNDDDSGSSNGGDTTDTGGDTGDDDASSAGVEEAKRLLAAETEPVTFAVPAGVGPVDLAATEGKKVAIINLIAAVPILTQWQDEMTEAFQGSGVELTYFDGAGNPAEWDRGIANAIADQADVIFMLGVPAQFIAPSVQDAVAAGIPVLTSLQGFAGKTRAEVPELTADVGFDYRVPGEMMGQWAVADSEGKGNILIFSSDDNGSSPDVWGGIEDEIDRLCPDCTVSRSDAVLAEWGDDTLQNRAKSLLQADPTITHVIAVYDAMTLAIEPAIVELGLENDVKVAGFNGTPAIMANVESGTAVKLEIGNPNMWMSAGMVDAVYSVLQGEDVIEDHNVPFRAFTVDNLDGIDTSFEDPQNWYGIDPLAEYRAIWGIGG
jgi:ribose transport system substrate-binding protein